MCTLSRITGLCAVLGFASPGLGAVFVNGSVATGVSQQGYLANKTHSGSLGVDLGLGPYVRVGVTHQQQFSQNQGYAKKKGLGEDESNDAETFDDYASKTHAIANSLDFTFILYEGDVVVPFLKAGFVKKSYFFEETRNDETEGASAALPPVPNLGAGVGFKLSREFTLRLQYSTSPGFRFVPGEDEPESVMDTKTTLGLSYRI